MKGPKFYPDKHMMPDFLTTLLKQKQYIVAMYGIGKKCYYCFRTTAWLVAVKTVMPAAKTEVI